METTPPVQPKVDDRPITPEMRERYERTFLVIAGVFLSALITCNLIFKKFFSFDIPLPWGGSYTFVQSVGILPYPLTFLATDLLSEVFGRRRANRVVLAGLAAAIFSVITLQLAQAAPEASVSPLTSGEFDKVFGVAWAAVLASMTAYLAAQFLDIRLFHFWRRLTNGRHLWLRNNASTIASQVLDTALVVTLLAALPGGGIAWAIVPGIILNGVLFKWAVAALDTPLFYLGVGICRKHFGPIMDEMHAEEEAAHRERRGIAGPEMVQSGKKSAE